MSATMQKDSKTAKSTNVANGSDPITDRAKEIATETAKPDVVGLEIAGQSDAFDAYFAASGRIGTMGLERIATALAESADLKTGRPGFREWHLYVMAVAVTRGPDRKRFDAKTQDDVLRHARRLFIKRLEDKGGLERADIDKIAAKFVKPTTKGDAKGSVQAKLVLAMPAAWEIAMG